MSSPLVRSDPTVPWPPLEPHQAPPGPSNTASLWHGRQKGLAKLGRRPAGSGDAPCPLAAPLRASPNMGSAGLGWNTYTYRAPCPRYPTRGRGAYVRGGTSSKSCRCPPPPAPARLRPRRDAPVADAAQHILSNPAPRPVRGVVSCAPRLKAGSARGKTSLIFPEMK